MKYFLDNLYLVFFSPVEFSYFWGEYRSIFAEFLIVLFSAFCFTLGISLHNPELANIVTFVYLFFWNIGFFSIFPLILAWFITQECIEFIIPTSKKIFISYIKYSLFLFCFLPAFAVWLNFFEWGSSAAFLFCLFVISLVYFLNIIRGVNAIYKLEMGLAFSVLLRSLYWILVLPFFFSFYYLITLLIFAL